ncbi:MAG: TIGR04002 family protein [Eubacteriales bacterium]
MKTKYITMTAIMTAIIYVTTAYIFHIPVSNGYVHIGDTFVYLAGCILPTQYAILAGVLGATLADGLTGYAVWILPSAIIKGLTAFVFTSKENVILCKKNIIALFFSLIFCTLGYFIAEVIIYGNVWSAIPSIFSSSMQTLVSSVLFIGIGKALDRIHFKNDMVRG